ncbi:MAG TPA: FtsW/RodA/SpoVE family cell cycle protein [Candidatus Cloacimonadota bacterium]|jgi:rod shape determining protein RodA|nr:FtsW/RodA/SpoVE family cell cycle protein [Candidatus Cloacimonadota bacterium]HOF59172.1 FtsW/RodA/SpoVE family cell cycle protein [Candidatus Cloacimonadota bacterium]HOR58029.1 FtsW/RodA/SpoVE family cell cycle protein [Candidatus Cloacimonadota bacterium]HPB08251.1 FtsW/RodA/SpoVE family cell cycle protein [Candidatus Cloacimonadota bacterium]HPL22912.1 FtsW/RodA/SpoVE family cell cycle protein [Candidatus Cloacimonadota bacterium]
MINRKKFDFVLAAYLLALILFGCVAIYTASCTTIGEYTTVASNWWKQTIFAAIAIGCMILLLRLPMPIFDIMILPLSILNILALIAVLFTQAIHGSHRWFSLMGIHYQPSESAKLLTIIMTARVISKEHLSELRQLFYGLGMIALPVALIIIEPDLGSTLVFGVSLLAMLVAADVPLFYLLLMVSPIVSIVSSVWWPAIIIWILILVFLLYRSGLSWVPITIASISNIFIALFMPVFWNGLKDYQQNRILTFVDPLRDPLGAGYQIIQAKIAVGSGSILGKGWLQGTQKNMNFLPVHHTDFIFSVIGEEFGFVGSMLLLLLFTLFFLRLIRAVGEIKVPERRIASAGILAYLMFQTFINIGMNIGLVPATGIPLPFISYGGSNLLINTLSVGVVLKYLNERGFMK